MIEFEIMLKNGMPLHFFQREFPQLAAIFIRVPEQVVSSVANRALNEASWDETGIVHSRQLLELEGLRGKQKRQDV